MLPCLLILVLTACTPPVTPQIYPDIRIAGAMRNVMWKGELSGIISLDTIQDRNGLYGLGPLSYLQGELLINDGQVYVSRVLSDSTMTVEENDRVSAPFFVYGNATNWREIPLPDSVRRILDLERFVDRQTREAKRPFVFKLQGTVASADIHIQNLPAGATVSSPQEAHRGQTNYTLENESVDIIGFFSTEHQGVFTHHDSYLHMHLITTDRQQMGHLDAAAFKKGKISLFLPVH
jgi:acetolactate decarboxylase